MAYATTTTTWSPQYLPTRTGDDIESEIYLYTQGMMDAEMAGEIDRAREQCRRESGADGALVGLSRVMYTVRIHNIFRKPLVKKKMKKKRFSYIVNNCNNNNIMCRVASVPAGIYGDKRGIYVIYLRVTRL